MLQLLQTFSFEQIIIFIVLLSCAVKESINFIDWVKKRIKKPFKKENMENMEKQKLEERLLFGDAKMKELEYGQIELRESVDYIHSKLDLLIDSDMNDIKAFITKEHHYFTRQGHIDDQSLEYLEKKFEIYQEEGGNSFVEKLMEDIRKLPIE